MSHQALQAGNNAAQKIRLSNKKEMSKSPNYVTTSATSVADKLAAVRPRTEVRRHAQAVACGISVLRFTSYRYDSTSQRGRYVSSG